MKSLSLSFIVLVFIYACNSNPPVTQGFTHIAPADPKQIIKMKDAGYDVKDTVSLLMEFFAPESIIHGVAKWKPDPEAQFNMNVSKDGYCYTHIDTIIKIDSGDNDKKGYGYHLPLYLIVFSTQHHYDNGESGSCSSCGANYGCACICDKTLKSFNRNFQTSLSDGSMNDIIAVRKIGRGNIVLDITTGYQGAAFYAFETLYDIRTFTPVFDFPCIDSHENVMEDTHGYITEMESKLVTVPNKKNEEYDDLKIIDTETTWNEERTKSTKKVSSQYYSWNNAMEQYESKKN
ncbi:MAG TPA: hypothetical protein VK890_11195 [Bacteroidia bacterium]|jgi:hypothetical protein|nr:hypothetical protein [Bacteroidia bacterium]